MPPITRALPRQTLLVAAVSFALASLAAPAAHAADAANAETGTASHADAPTAPATATAPASSSAQPDGADRAVDTLEEVEVHGHRPEQAASPKYTQPLLDTPQTITQVPRAVLEGQNLLGLQEILATLPGITFGAGEGGGGYGDSINLRGFSSNADITVDGLRDSAQYTRSDTFNLEAVEVVNGADSVHSGAGAVGGSINLVSKVAGDEAFNRAQLGLGTDDYRRATADSNLLLGEGVALRLNAMAHENDVPGRDVEREERWGVAPSLAVGLGGDTVASLSWLHQEDTNTPQYGVPFFNGGPLPGVDPTTYFGYANLDVQETDVDTVTLRVEHRISDAVTIDSITRYGETTQYSVVDPPQGTYCLASGINPATGAACTALGTYQPSGPRGTTRDTRNIIAVHQTQVTTRFDTGGVGHDLVAGVALSRERFDLLSGNVLRSADGATPNPVLPVMDLVAPDTTWRGPVNFIPSARQVGELENQAVYVFDTLAFTDALRLDLGARYERNEGRHRTDAIATPAAGGATTPGTTFTNDEDLFSYRAGLVYKPSDAGTVYLAYGTSNTPSKASVNGACTAQTCAVDPESADSLELGTKWELLDGALMLTASVFRNDRENYRVADTGNPDNPSGEQQLDGRARVDGLLLGAMGRINERWYVYANYSRLESEVVQGTSDYIASQGGDYTRGDRLLNTPEDAVGLWTTYDVSRRWQLGYGASYQGKVWLTQHSAANPDGPLVTSPGYWVHRAMVRWQATRDLALQLNLNNLFDEVYYARPRNNGWAMPGEARNAMLTATFTY